METWEVPEEKSSEVYIKFVVRDEGTFISNSFRTMDLEDEVIFVVGKTLSDPEGNMILKEVRFDRSNFSKEEAQIWVKEHPGLLKAFSDEIFNVPVAVKAENMLVELSELDPETLSKTDVDEVEAIHALLHAMYFRDRAEMSTEGWDSTRIKNYHGTIVGEMKRKELSHYYISDLDNNTETIKEIGASTAGDVMTQPDIGKHKFRSVLTNVSQGHSHCAVIGPDGNGFTSTQKSHTHLIEGSKVLIESEHSHSLTNNRCNADQLKWLESTNAEVLKSFVLKSIVIS